MGQVNISLPSDGSTATVSQYNTPLTSIVDEINGNLDNSNIATGAAIATSKLATDAGITTGMLQDKAVTAKKIDFGGDGEGVWWEEIGRTVLESAGDTITVSDLPAKKHLMILASVAPTGGTVNGALQFNGDSNNNYAYRRSVNNGSDGTTTSTGNMLVSTNSIAAPHKAIVWIDNYESVEKNAYWLSTDRGTAGAGNLPNRVDGGGKWANTANQITSVAYINTGTGDYAIGSEVIVLGHN